MKAKYNNYMVQEINKDNEDWTVAVFQDYKEAVKFAEAYIPKEAKLIEIWATDEDTSTFSSCDTVYIRNLEYGNSVDLIELNDSDQFTALSITSLAYKLYDEEGEATPEEYISMLQTIKGCHSIIEYLLETIDDILNK